ncbi:MAG: hypothetical protein FJ263_07270 [Planctomycetes bacterium]|nr:hypothetical protein [Planctomycetota bacterium]
MVCFNWNPIQDIDLGLNGIDKTWAEREPDRDFIGSSGHDRIAMERRTDVWYNWGYTHFRIFPAIALATAGRVSNFDFTQYPPRLLNPRPVRPNNLAQPGWGKNNHPACHPERAK